MTIFDLMQATLLLKKLHEDYSANPEKIACDLISLIARVAHGRGVHREDMVDAVLIGAGYHPIYGRKKN